MQRFAPLEEFDTPIRSVWDVACLVSGLVEVAKASEVVAVHLGHQERLLGVVVYDRHAPRRRPDRWLIANDAVAYDAVSFWLVGLSQASWLEASEHREWCALMNQEVMGSRFEGWLQLDSERISSLGVAGL